MSISKNQIRFVTGLQLKKNRWKHRMFVAEGKKVVEEFIQADFRLEQLYCTADSDMATRAGSLVITEKELKRISAQKSPNKVLAVFRMPESTDIDLNCTSVVLDSLNDPGNLGTIIRLCDWFGIKQLVCSRDTADCFNSKVVQSAMGSLSRVHLQYTDLTSYLERCTPVKYAADMQGETVYSASLEREFVLLMGNEANGIRRELYAFVDTVCSIPRFGEVQKTESLNVATATAVLLSEFRRRML